VVLVVDPVVGAAIDRLLLRKAPTEFESRGGKLPQETRSRGAFSGSAAACASCLNWSQIRCAPR